MKTPPRPQSAEPYQWPDGKRCALCFSLDLDAESPYLWLHRGKPVTGLQELEQRRFGPRVGIWRVLDLLAELDVPGSFFVPGWVAARHPALLPALLERGHEIGYHGYYHERLDQLAPGEGERFLDRTIAEFEHQTGRAGYGYRSPSWEMTPEYLQLLRERGIAYDSSLMGFDHPYTISAMTEVPVTWTIDDALYFRYTASARDKTHPANPMAVLESWTEELEGIREVGGLFMITVHEWISGRAQRLRMLRRLLEHARQHSDIWIANVGEVARWHAGSVNADRYAVEALCLDTAF